jgi:hypothetical protein
LIFRYGGIQFNVKYLLNIKILNDNKKKSEISNYFTKFW